MTTENPWRLEINRPNATRVNHTLHNPSGGSGGSTYSGGGIKPAIAYARRCVAHAGATDFRVTVTDRFGRTKTWTESV